MRHKQKQSPADNQTVLNFFFFYFTFTDLTIYSKFLSFLTVNTFTKHSYQKLQTVQFVKYTHGSERKHLYWLQQVHTSTTNR